MATPAELSGFLKDVEKRAFKKTFYHVRNEESALDVVQDSMMKLAENYGHKPLQELPPLFQRILSNCTLDWFRRQKVKTALFSSFGEFQTTDGEEEFDILERLSVTQAAGNSLNPETTLQRRQILKAIEDELWLLPDRQREAFLLRYWEDMDVAETATAMGCSDGSVKTHCSRAVKTLYKALQAKGIKA